MRSGVDVFHSLEALPGAARAIFPSAGGKNYFATIGWYETVLAAGVPAGMTAALAVAEGGGVLLPLLLDARGRPVQGLTTPYTCLFAPLIADDLDGPGVLAAGASLGRFLRSGGVVRLDAMAADDARGKMLIAGMGRAGLIAARFDHFGNWHEPLEGRSWDAYLAAGAGSLRETVRRKLRKAEKDRCLRFDLIVDEAGLDAGIAGYESVYARSWKEQEPFPDFSRRFMRRAARDGVLRLGLLWENDLPIATQMWTVTGKAATGGVASVLKLAHDERFKPRSPGTVLTALMMRHLIDVERVDSLDFGRGDDPYKQLWATRREQRIGFLLANPLSPRGALQAARHAAGRLRKAFPRGGPAGGPAGVATNG